MIDKLATNHLTPLTAALKQCFKERLDNPNDERTIEGTRDRLMSVFYANCSNSGRGHQENGFCFLSGLFGETTRNVRTTMDKIHSSIWKDNIGYMTNRVGRCLCGKIWREKVTKFDIEVNTSFMDNV